MNYSDIPRFTRNPSYRVTADWGYLEGTLDRWVNERGVGMAKLDLDPEFQRAHVWTEPQQIAYVEYALKGGTSGKEIYLNCTGWMRNWEGPFILVDGKQRLEAVRKFLRNELPVFGGHTYSQIEGRLPHTASLYININDLPYKDVLQWYLEMNTGGTPHTPAEIEKVKLLLGNKV